MKFVVISDTHGDHHHLDLPQGDVIVHAGDVSSQGKQDQVEDFIAWFDDLNFQHKVLIGGNHDWFMESSPEKFAELIHSSSINYLNDSGITIEGISLWGSPITTEFYQWAFQRKAGADIRHHWAMIPDGTDILITHGPPRGIMDEVPRDASWDPELAEIPPGSGIVHAGCPDLLDRIWQVAPAYHLFGHIHEGYGLREIRDVNFINAASMDASYRLKNQPIVFEFEQTRKN